MFGFGAIGTTALGSSAVQQAVPTVPLQPLTIDPRYVLTYLSASTPRKRSIVGAARTYQTKAPARNYTVK